MKHVGATRLRNQLTVILVLFLRGIFTVPAIGSIHTAAGLSGIGMPVTNDRWSNRKHRRSRVGVRSPLVGLAPGIEWRQWEVPRTGRPRVLVLRVLDDLTVENNHFDARSSAAPAPSFLLYAPLCASFSRSIARVLAQSRKPRAFSGLPLSGVQNRDERETLPWSSRCIG